MSSFAKFDDVERWYNQTKPMGGAVNKGLDIRPIGDRNRKYERIVKIDPDCYALSCGWHRGDILFPITLDYEPTLSDMEAFAPIVWRRYGYGVDRVTIRNGIGPYAMHPRVYKFLKHNMPSGLTFVQGKQGKQFIKIQRTGAELFLAKGTHVHPTEYAAILAERARGNTSAYRTRPWCTGTEDTTSLIFQRNGDTWEFISHNGVAPPVSRTLVDREAKARYKDAIKTFCDWALTVAPMIAIHDFRVRQEYHDQLTEYMTAYPTSQYRRWGLLHKRLPPETLRGIIAFSDHPMRTVVMVIMMYETEMYRQPIRDQDDLTYIRIRLNRWINKTLGFTTKG